MRPSLGPIGGLAVCISLAFACCGLAQDAQTEIPQDNPPSAQVKPAEPAQQAEQVQEESTEPAEARQARIKDLLSLVSDNTLVSHKRESPAYFALIKELLDQTPDQLRAKARENPRFHDFYANPANHRGEIVHLALNLRRVLEIDIKNENEAGVKKLYELWGWTDEAKAWMYCCIAPELPPEVALGDVQQRIELTGYFFKMQAYQPGDAAPNAKNLVAPLILGRIVASPKVSTENTDALNRWPMYLIAGFGILVLFRLVLQVRNFTRPAPTHRNYRRRSLEPIDPEAVDDSVGTGSGLKIRNANE